MARVSMTKKACTVNPLRMSQTIGAALAFLGMERALPLLHGSQGCTAFGLVLFVRHFRETIPLQTTAMSEVATILGGLDNIGEALTNIHKRARPALVGLCSTALTETRGDDIAGYLKLFREAHPELADMEVVYVPVPEYAGAFQDGWARAVERMIDQCARPASVRTPWKVNILPGCHLSPGDVEELREIVEAFGLYPVMLPDLSGSLDGHVPETFLPHTLGGTSLAALRGMGEAALTIAIGEQMRPAAELLRARCGTPFEVFDRLTGLAACDALMHLLSEVSESEVPAKYKRQRSQLLDAMLDGHFHFGAKRVAIAAEPDLLHALAGFFTDLGASVEVAVTSTASPLLERLPCEEVLIGDLEDFEARAAGCDLLVTHSHGRQAAARLGIPLYRAGLPLFDRLGAAQKLGVGYRGTRDLIFEIANVFVEQQHEHTPADWNADALSHTPTVPCH